MLQAMGWKEGSGLGRNRQGITAPIQVRYSMYFPNSAATIEFIINNWGNLIWLLITWCQYNSFSIDPLWNSDFLSLKFTFILAFLQLHRGIQTCYFCLLLHVSHLFCVLIRISQHLTHPLHKDACQWNSCFGEGVRNLKLVPGKYHNSGIESKCCH